MQIDEFKVFLEDFVSKNGQTFKKISVKYADKELFMYFVDDKTQLILDLLGYKDKEGDK